MARHHRKVMLTDMQIADLDERVLAEVRFVDSAHFVYANLRKWIVSTLPRRQYPSRYITQSLQRLRAADRIKYEGRRWLPR